MNTSNTRCTPSQFLSVIVQSVREASGSFDEDIQRSDGLFSSHQQETLRQNIPEKKFHTSDSDTPLGSMFAPKTAYSLCYQRLGVYLLPTETDRSDRFFHLQMLPTGS